MHSSGNAMGIGVMLGWAQIGVVLDKELETQESLTIYISVPEHSCERDAHGQEMAGPYLAKRIKKTLVEMGVKRLTVKYKTRIGDYWTKEKGKQADLEMRKTLFGSQY